MRLQITIGVSSYEIKKYMPKDIIDRLPREEDINLHINIDDNIEQEGEK